MSFFPSNFEVPTSNSGYMKLQPGENRIRILSDPIIGWQDWDSIRNKPVRHKYDNKPLSPLDPKRPTVLFIAMIVWDYVQSKVSILQINQASIMKALDALSKDKDWGSVFRYDLKINKVKRKQDAALEGMNVLYEVKPVPHRDLDAGIKLAYEDTPINLEELFKGEDPFKSAFRTKSFWQMVSEPASSTEYISMQELAYIEDMIAKRIAPASAEWKGNALNALQIQSFGQLPKARYSLVIKRIDEKIADLLAQECPF